MPGGTGRLFSACFDQVVFAECIEGVVVGMLQGLVGYIREGFGVESDTGCVGGGKGKCIGGSVFYFGEGE